jgi:dipeptidyl aminopeptidase/acylaminoacyl peptidase
MNSFSFSRVIFSAGLLMAGLLPGGCGPQGAPAAAPLPPKIPLTDFFDNPKISSAHISPDGTRLAFLAPDRGKLNVWVCALNEGPAKARLITRDEKRGIMYFFWTRDSRYVLYLQDQGGNENFHLYRADPSAEKIDPADLTPFDGARAEVIDLPREHPQKMLVALNSRDKRVFDVYELEIASGKLRLIEKNPGDVDSWVTDTKGVLRGCLASPGKGMTEIRVRDTGTGPFRMLARYTDEEDGGLTAFGKDGTFVYGTNARDSNTTRLVKIDLATGKETVVDEDPEYDVEEALISDVTHEILAVSYDKDRLVYKPYDRQFAKDLDILKRTHDGDVLFISSDAKEQKWIVAYNSPTDPGATYLYDRATGQTEFLYRPRPWLKADQLVGMEPISYISRDGLEIHGYLTVPKGLKPENLPLLLVVHGGPWARDDWGYDPEVQFLANRGYAVLQVNYRGSTGYGKKFLHAGDKEWGGRMLDDLVDGVTWAVGKGIADPERLGIYGGSYGGYATLSALAFEPKVFKCGIDYVGISNLLTFMNTIPPYWDTFRDTMYQRVGNPKTETEFLKSRSPLFSAGKIEAPLFIAQGFNDPRVNHAEAEQIVKALQDRGKTVEYMLKMDEGHGFANPKNRLDFYRKMETFLGANLK